MDLRTLCDRFDERLDSGAYADVDPSVNGLQVGIDEGQVERVALAVDTAAATVETAVERGADVLVVHHGLSWGGIERVTGREYRRIAPLVEHDVALYAAHLPLDGHQELGNAAGLAGLLGLEECDPFGVTGPVYIGQRGHASDSFGRSELASVLDAELDTGDRDVQVLAFGPETVEDVAIVTGSGVDWLDEAVEAGADALVTGEGKQQVYHQAREAGINVYLAGHYATETFGVRALGDLAREWSLETTFVDHPTGL